MSGKASNNGLVLIKTAEEGPCPAAPMKNLLVPNPPPYVVKDPAGKTIVLGIEGSANKVGVGIVQYFDDSYEVLSNPRKTFVAPTG